MGEGYYEQEAEKLKATLEAEGLWADGMTPKPWHGVALRHASAVRLGGGGPVVGGQAVLDFVIATGIDRAIDGLVRATDRLVESSNDNTAKMSALATQLNALTRVVAVAAIASAVAAALSAYAALRAVLNP